MSLQMVSKPSPNFANIVDFRDQSWRFLMCHWIFVIYHSLMYYNDLKSKRFSFTKQSFLSRIDLTTVVISLILFTYFYFFASWLIFVIVSFWLGIWRVDTKCIHTANKFFFFYFVGPGNGVHWDIYKFLFTLLPQKIKP